MPLGRIPGRMAQVNTVAVRLSKCGDVFSSGKFRYFQQSRASSPKGSFRVFQGQGGCFQHF